MSITNLVARIDDHLAHTAHLSALEAAVEAGVPAKVALLAAALADSYGVDLEPSEFDDMFQAADDRLLFSVSVAGIRFHGVSDLNEDGDPPEYAALLDAAGHAMSLAEVRAVIVGDRAM